jgi:RNA-binding protein YlmH
MKTTEFLISFKDEGKRVDVQASEMSGLTRSQVQRLIEKGLLMVNQLPTNPTTGQNTGISYP